MTLARPEKIPASNMRRGSCPTLARPMKTGDGLLARLRPLDCTIGVDALRAIAQSAAEFGNGILEITARGSLQIRGLRPETVASFERAVLETGVKIPPGPMIETPPLAGLDPDELVDVRPLAARLRKRIEEHKPLLALAPKLAITVDGGGRFHLGEVAADIRIAAYGGEGDYLLSVSGIAASARPVALLRQGEIDDAVVRLLEMLADLGPAARGKDLTADRLAAHIPAIKPTVAALTEPVQPCGLHTMEGGTIAVGVVLPYRQVHAVTLIEFLDPVKRAGAGRVYLAPGHALFVAGLSRPAGESLQRRATELGFWTDPGDIRANISLCAGSQGCASAFFDTKQLADAVLQDAPDLLDGSCTLHLSGCAKGCAHPAPSGLALIGTPTGYGLVVNGAASNEPVAYIAANDVKPLLSRLALLVAQSRQAGESVHTCLTRLGADRIGAALKMENT
ncbi:precorrin-3B synthase [Rhizobium sp. KVB221]|uniref:Precorrin-3B synthase n=1 Tax=Rhizobium setariae TaxID=2801340 RepID=A0A936YNV2_9HYPH|nr:precorrin-3B synthase [Rhizobium setariae]MBL0373930.1 precorrin-3B synthase [Rhizobium setariae]